MQKALAIISLLLLLAAPLAWCDNEAGGSDMPWDGDPPSDIKTVCSDSISRLPKIYYDLQGRRVDCPTPGNIYIVNGKKILLTK